MYAYIRTGKSERGECWSFVAKKRKLFRSKEDLTNDFFMSLDHRGRIIIDERRAQGIKIKVFSKDDKLKIPRKNPWD